ncbi:triose-phosphate isomerase [Bowmanella dokdonensis]
MNGDLKLASAMQSALQDADLTDLDVVVCPPFPFLASFDSDKFALGAQDLSHFESGAHTGEVAAGMLREVGCQYVIVGHSERRTDQQESNELVAEKVAAALGAELTPILCVGEPLPVREAGDELHYVSAQLDAVVTRVGAPQLSKMVIAYEPIWAIGTGNTATPEQAQDVHAHIRRHLSKANAEAAAGLRILYGGSVNADNAVQLFAQPDVDGGLIGGASLKKDDFLAICQAAK